MEPSGILRKLVHHLSVSATTANNPDTSRTLAPILVQLKLSNVITARDSDMFKQIVQHLELRAEHQPPAVATTVEMLAILLETAQWVDPSVLDVVPLGEASVDTALLDRRPLATNAEDQITMPEIAKLRP